jgi:hypothetical protein
VLGCGVRRASCARASIGRNARRRNYVQLRQGSRRFEDDRVSAIASRGVTLLQFNRPVCNREAELELQRLNKHAASILAAFRVRKNPAEWASDFTANSQTRTRSLTQGSRECTGVQVEQQTPRGGRPPEAAVRLWRHVGAQQMQKLLDCMQATGEVWDGHDSRSTTGPSVVEQPGEEEYSWGNQRLYKDGKGEGANRPMCSCATLVEESASLFTMQWIYTVVGGLKLGFISHAPAGVPLNLATSSAPCTDMHLLELKLLVLDHLLNETGTACLTPTPPTDAPGVIWQPLSPSYPMMQELQSPPPRALVWPLHLSAAGVLGRGPEQAQPRLAEPLRHGVAVEEAVGEGKAVGEGWGD